MGLWRDVFGPGKNEVWSGIAKQVGADFTPGGWMRKGRIDLQRDGYLITLDTYDVSVGEHSQTHTRMRSPFRNNRNMEMHIFREGMFASLGKMMGMRDLIVGDPFFDKEFVIQGSPENKIVTFLQDAKIRKLIQAQPRIAFGIRKDKGWFCKQYPDGIDELFFQCNGTLKDEQRLRQLFELFVAAIDRLQEVEPGCVFDVAVRPA